jgi:hypothetical protein
MSDVPPSSPEIEKLKEQEEEEKQPIENQDPSSFEQMGVVVGPYAKNVRSGKTSIIFEKTPIKHCEPETQV